MFDKHPVMGRKCVINLYSGSAIEGVCTHVKPTYVLRNAVLHHAGHQPTPVDGHISIDMGNVDFIQILN